MPVQDYPPQLGGARQPRYKIIKRYLFTFYFSIYLYKIIKSPNHLFNWNWLTVYTQIKHVVSYTIATFFDWKLIIQ